jgi:hypothetical protein
MKKLFAKMFCRHTTQAKSSCPFTGKTYTMCEKCLKRLKVEVTINEQ